MEFLSFASEELLNYTLLNIISVDQAYYKKIVLKGNYFNVTSFLSNGKQHLKNC